MFLEDVIRRNIQELFPGTHVEGAHLFRIIRDTDMVIQEDEADDLLESVDRGLKQLRYGALSLLQVEDDMPRRVLNILVENFEVEEDIVVRTSERMGFADWSALTKMHRPALKDPVFHPRLLWPPDEADKVFEQIADQDFLSTTRSIRSRRVETFLRAAVNDPQVVAIKMTLYRIGANSPLVDLLIEAAEQGKQVAVLVELKARFDERNNIAWATRLESAGIHVVYGLVNLKVHCKLTLVVRQEADGIRRYAHIATGNYNRVTSQVYTDLGLFTADQALVDDVTEVFNFLTGLLEQALVQRAAGGAGWFAAGLQGAHRSRDRARAARPAGAHHHQEQRGCRPGDDQGAVSRVAGGRQGRHDRARRVLPAARAFPGSATTSRVRSIVGRFLEHSRIYYFLNGGDEEVYIGSADLMERNLDRRVEVISPIKDAAHQAPPARRGARGAAERHPSRLGAADRRQLHARAPARRRRAAQLAAVPPRVVLEARPASGVRTRAARARV